MSNKIFISSNNFEFKKYKSPLRGLYDNIADDTLLESEIFKSLIFPDNCDVLYYNHQYRIFDTESKESDIILLRDSLKSIPSDLTIDPVSDYHLHHSGDSEKLLPFTKKKKGEHTVGVENKYEPVFNIIFDEEDNKADRIFKFLFPNHFSGTDSEGETTPVDAFSEYRELNRQLTIETVKMLLSTTASKNKSHEITKKLNHVIQFFEVKNNPIAEKLKALNNISDLKEFHLELQKYHDAIHDAFTDKNS